jgi:hypothetical protein
MAVEAPMSATSTLAERRTALTVEQDALRIQRGAALLDGGKFDSRRLSAIEVELEATEEVEAESARRERDATAAAEKAAEELRLVAARQANADRLTALEEAETAAHAMLAALRTFLDKTAAIADVSPSSNLSARQAEQRVSRLLASMLATISTNPFGFGVANWNSIPPEYAGRWLDVEQKFTASATQHLSQTKEQSLND